MNGLHLLLWFAAEASPLVADPGFPRWSVNPKAVKFFPKLHSYKNGKSETAGMKFLGLFLEESDAILEQSFVNHSSYIKVPEDL